MLFTQFKMKRYINNNIFVKIKIKKKISKYFFLY